MAASKRKSNVNAAFAIGLKRAEETLRRRRRAISTRRAALAQTGTKMLATAKAAAPSAGTLIAEGDSWFDYPLNDVLSDLYDKYGYDVESVAHKGDRVEDMAYSKGQLDDFSRHVEKALGTGVPPRAILLSGGGNDVAGDAFTLLLNHAASSISGLNDSIVTGVIDQRSRDSYITIMSAITAVCVGHLGRPVPTIVHGYDYPVPDGRGFWGGWGPLPGPWLEPGFRQKGYGDMAVRKALCVKLIDRFNAMLRSLAGKAPFAHVKYLNLRGTLSTGSNYKAWWDNELHPTKQGFEAVTKKFATTIAAL